MIGTASQVVLRKSPSNLLGLALVRLLDVVSSGSLRVSVSVTDAQEVIALRQEVAALRDALERERSIRVRAENLYGDEVFLNGELLDYCRLHGVPVPKYFFTRRRKS